jgi:hypothetical protein
MMTTSMISINDLSHAEIHNRRARIFDDVGRDDWISGHTEDTAIAFAPGLLREHMLHLIHRWITVTGAAKHAGREDST